MSRRTLPRHQLELETVLKKGETSSPPFRQPLQSEPERENLSRGPNPKSTGDNGHNNWSQLRRPRVPPCLLSAVNPIAEPQCGAKA